MGRRLSDACKPYGVTRYRPGTSRVNEVRFTYPAFFLDSTAFTRDTTFRSYDAAGNVANGWERPWGNGYRKVHTRSYYGADNKLRAQQGYNEMGVEFKGERSLLTCSRRHSEPGL